jgi:hypothetical protein
MPVVPRPVLLRPDVTIVPPGEPERRLSDSPARETADLPPETMPPGSGAERGDAPATLDGECEPDVGMRLGARETFDPELLPELDEPDSPPLEPELELVDPEPPEDPELDPDEPELEDPDELPRGTACAPARAGAASTTETTRLSARRADLAMAALPRFLRGISSTGASCNSTATARGRKYLVSHDLSPKLSCGLALLCGR